MCSRSVDGCEGKREPRPQTSFHLESEGLNCHFKAETLSLSSELSLAILAYITSENMLIYLLKIAAYSQNPE